MVSAVINLVCDFTVIKLKIDPNSILIIGARSTKTYLSENIVNLIDNRTFLTTFVLCQSLSYSLANHYLKSNFNRVQHSVYCSKWYTMPLKIQKILIFVLMKTNHPTKFIVNFHFRTGLITTFEMMSLVI